MRRRLSGRRLSQGQRKRFAPRIPSTCGRCSIVFALIGNSDFPSRTRSSSGGLRSIAVPVLERTARRSAPSISRHTPRAPPAMSCAINTSPSSGAWRGRFRKHRDRSNAEKFVLRSSPCHGALGTVSFRFAFRTQVRISNTADTEAVEFQERKRWQRRQQPKRPAQQQPRQRR